MSTDELHASAGTVDLRARVVRTDEGERALSELECKLLRYLRDNQHRVVSREELLEQVWGYAPSVRSRTVEVTVQRVRAKIEADPNQPQTLLTSRGEGYRFCAPVFSLQAALPAIPRLPPEALVGRDRELAQLREALGQGRLITLTGPPGVGKSWLARVALTELAEQRPPGKVWFASLQGCASPDELSGAVASGLGLAATEPAELVRALEGTTGLLDDAQGLAPDAAACLTDWLRASPSCRLLLTSQRRMGLELEQRIAVDPLDPRDGALLLRRRLAALGLPAPPDEDIEALVAHVGALPLGIELLAPMLEIWPPARLLRADPLGLSAERPDLPDRHRSLLGAVASAVQALPPDARTLLARLGVFQSPFDLDAAERIGGEGTEAALALLVRRSLVRRLGERFELYEVVRSFAARMLDEDLPLRQETEGRHVAWLLARYDQAEADRSHGASFEPVRADLLWAIRRARVDSLPQLVGALADLVYRKGALPSLPPLLDELLQQPLPEEIRARLLERRSAARRWVGDLPGAVADAREALALAGPVGPAVLSLLWGTMAAALEASGRNEEAIDAGERAVAFGRASGEPDRVHVALIILAVAWSDLDPVRARQLHEEAAQVALGYGDRANAAIALANAANQQAETDPAGARDGYRQALEWASGEGHPHFEAVVMGNLAIALSEAGELEEAEHLFAQALSRLSSLGDELNAAIFELHRAVNTALSGGIQRAIGMLRAVQPALAGRAPRMSARARLYLALLTRQRDQLLPGEWDLDEVAVCLLDGQPPDPGRRLPELPVLEALLRAGDPARL